MAGVFCYVEKIMKTTRKEAEKKNQEKKIEIRKETNFTFFSWHSVSTHHEFGEREEKSNLISSNTIKNLIEHFMSSPSLVNFLVALYFSLAKK